MAYTVEDAVAAVANRQATLPADKVAYIEASVSITDAGAGTITGKGPLGRAGPQALTNMGSIWDAPLKFFMQRGATGPGFLLGLNIEPIYALIGPVVFRPPTFVASFIQRYRFPIRRTHYQGDFALYMQPPFGVVLTEDQSPKLTGTIAASTLTPGPIVPPGTIEVVLDSVAVADVFQ
jgi:hypothetical protein